MIAAVSKGECRNGAVAVPASKSLSHRALLAASLCKGTCLIRNLGTSRDIQATRGAMEHFGARFEDTEDGVIVHGTPRPVYDGGVVDCIESGSTLRFLIPVAAMQEQEAVFSGHGRLMERPQTVYEEIFRSRGLLFEKKDGQLHVRGPLTGGTYEVEGNISSQFISGLLFALPLAEKDSTIIVRPPFESESYVGLTEDVLAKAGIRIERDGLTFHIAKGQHYSVRELSVPGDDSQMAFFAAEALIRNAKIEVTNADHDSRQGDHVIVDHIRSFGGHAAETEKGYCFSGGKLHSTEIDLGDCPDLGPVLFALASRAEGETVFTHCERLRIKESDRIACMEEELAKLGCFMESEGGTVRVRGITPVRGGAHLSGHNDHRIVMALSVLASSSEVPVYIHGAEAVSKSYPDFFRDLSGTGVKVEYAEE